jgi:hypothetical protein
MDLDSRQNLLKILGLLFWAQVFVPIEKRSSINNEEGLGWKSKRHGSLTSKLGVSLLVFLEVAISCKTQTHD